MSPARPTAVRPKLAGVARLPVQPSRVAATGARPSRRTSPQVPKGSRPPARLSLTSSRTAPLIPRPAQPAGPPGPPASSQPAARPQRRNQPARAGVPRRPQTKSRPAQARSPMRRPPQQRVPTRLPRPSQRQRQRSPALHQGVRRPAYPARSIPAPANLPTRDAMYSPPCPGPRLPVTNLMEPRRTAPAGAGQGRLNLARPRRRRPAPARPSQARMTQAARGPTTRGRAALQPAGPAWQLSPRPAGPSPG
jgi:RNA-binding protein with serine-rich domain 1